MHQQGGTVMEQKRNGHNLLAIYGLENGKLY